jgi:hypothetical protein
MPTDRLPAGTRVHVRDATPQGWVGTICSLTGSTYIVVDDHGIWRMVDYTRQKMTPL